MTGRLTVWGISGLGEFGAGDDVGAAIAGAEPDLRDGDVVVVTSKVVSKAEGRIVDLPREEAIGRETVRLVAARGATRIVETRHGFVMAAAGVDESNVAAGTVALLPVDPDASARTIRTRLRELRGVDVAVIVTDTFGRPWRNGLVDVAIGAAGIDVLDDHRGRNDAFGHTLEMTVTAVADEIAAAAELVKGKLDGVPVAVVRGLLYRSPQPDDGARALIRAAADDMFRLGTREAMRSALFVTDSGSPKPSYDDPVVTAVAAARAAPQPVGASAWQVSHDGTTIVGCVSTALDAPARQRALLAVGAALGNAVLALAVEGIAATWDASDHLGHIAVPEGWEVVAAVTVTTG